MNLIQSEVSRFWTKVEKSDPSNCWVWKSAKDSSGYGVFYAPWNLPSKKVKASRYSWFIHNGTIPDGLWVLHKCDNPSCVNPYHLFLGNQTDNMRDAMRKGRLKVPDWRLTKKPKGEEHHNAVLTAEGAMEIVNAPRKHGVYAALARKLGVTKVSVSCVLSGKTWSHVTGRTRNQKANPKQKPNTILTIGAATL